MGGWPICTQDLNIFYFRSLQHCSMIALTSCLIFRILQSYIIYSKDHHYNCHGCFIFIKLISRLTNMSKSQRRLITTNPNVLTQSSLEIQSEEQAQHFKSQQRKEQEDAGISIKYRRMAGIIGSIIIFALVYSLAQGSEQKTYVPVKMHMKQFVVQALKNLDESPTKYVQIETLSSHEELPFCIVVDEKHWDQNEKLKLSLDQQSYKKYKTVTFNFSKDISEQSKDNNKQKQNKESERQKNDFHSLMMRIQQQCPQKSIIFFLTEPLAKDSLQSQNQYYQTYQTWMLYSLLNQDSKDVSEVPRLTKSTKGVQIFSIYKRILQLIISNDFLKTNSKLLFEHFNSDLIMASLFQLCKYFALAVPKAAVYTKQDTVVEQRVLYMNFSAASTSDKIKRAQYQPLHSMNQDYKINNGQWLHNKRKEFFRSKSTLTESLAYVIPRPSIMEHIDVERALQYEQIIYLPETHSLNLLQIHRMEKVHQTNLYSNNELPLCISINSHNNVPNDRYKKVLDSVTAQNYSNFVIVFIDDFSTDETFEKTRHYLHDILKFPKNQSILIRNQKQRMATYNFLNAAFNYCSRDSIQVVVDGDDQLIGKQVFQLINARYQADNLWVMYTFYKNDKYEQGISIPFKEEYLTGLFGGRKLIYFFGHVRTHKVSLLRQVPLRDHLNQRGEFLQTLCDTAMQFPFFEMSGEKHGKYVHEITYLYFSGYGANDDSNLGKMTYRNLLNFFISFRQPVPRLSKLEDDIENEEVRNILTKQNIKHPAHVIKSN